MRVFYEGLTFASALIEWVFLIVKSNRDINTGILK